MAVSIKINGAAVKKELREPSVRLAKAIVEQRVLPEVERANKQAIRSILANAITKEIQAGPLADNTSFTLNGYGNLFSFLGFHIEDKPIQALLTVLTNCFKLRSVKSATGNSYQIIVTIDYPSMEEINKEGLLELPWASGFSWVKAIEDGVSGLSLYLYNEEGFYTSRSDTGIQIAPRKKSSNKLNTEGSSGNRLRGSFDGAPYLTEILEKAAAGMVSRINRSVIL